MVFWWRPSQNICFSGDLVEADAVHEVATIETAIIEAVPATASAWPPEYLTGLYRGGEGFVLMPDLDHILSVLAQRPIV